MFSGFRISSSVASLSNFRRLTVNRRAIVTHYRGNRRPKLTPLKLIDSTHLVVWTDGVRGDVDSGDDCADPSGSSGSGGADQADCP